MYQVRARRCQTTGIVRHQQHRSRELFHNGHVDWTTLSVVEGVTVVGDRRVYLFKVAVTVSHRVRSYNVVLMYDIELGKVMTPPGIRCECVVHLGPD